MPYVNIAPPCNNANDDQNDELLRKIAGPRIRNDIQGEAPIAREFTIRVSALLLAAASFASGAVASEVFTWRDENGVTHYSQWAPDNVANVSKLVVNAANPPGYDANEDLYSIRNQAERTNETWKALEDRKEERREQKRAESRQEARYSPPPYDPYPYYTPPWYYRPIHRPIYRPAPLLNRPPHVQPKRSRPSSAQASYSPDPMRSAHIGVRRNPATHPPMRIE